MFALIVSPIRRSSQVNPRKVLAKLGNWPLNGDMRLQHVQTLLALAQAGSIRAAAERMGKSQSALTKQLQQMEEEIGISLFQRTSRGIVPTEQGLSVLGRARSVEAELCRLDQEIDDLRGLQSGSIRVSVAPLAAVKILPRAIARFRQAYPDIDIAISSDLFSDALNALREGQHDIIIGPYARAYDMSDVICEELFTTDVAFITSKNAPHANAVSLKQLVDCTWVKMGNMAEAPEKKFREHFVRRGLQPPRIRLASESRLGLLSLVEELDAVCSFPVRLLEDLGPAQNITRIPVEETLEPLAISMVIRTGQSLTPAGEKLADCIRHRAEFVVREWGKS